MKHLSQGVFIIIIVFGCLCSIAIAGSIKAGQENPYNAQQSLFRWVDSSRALLLQRITNRVYFTKDGGMTWGDLASQLTGSTEPGSEPGFLYPNDVDPHKIYIRGNGNTCWRSLNKGEVWEAFTPNPPLLYRNLLWHPFKPEWAIAGVETMYTDTDGTVDLYLTQDFGSNWNLVASNITRPAYNWGDAGRGTVTPWRIYFAKNDVNGQYLDFYQTDDFGNKLVVVQSKTRGFLFLDKQLFVAVYLPEAQETILKVSPNIGFKYKVFYEAQFPFGKTLQYNGYSILDDTTGAVFLGVNHGDLYAHWGNLYLSDSLGISYSTSLLHVSQLFGLYDFTRVRGLEGVYLANTVVDWEDKETTNSNSILQTGVTFNNGGEWKPVQRPFYDSNNQPIQCSGNCQLHLHGFTSFYTEEGENYGPFYSSQNTIGLLIANGNVGQYLSHDRADIGTYLSRDAGLSWIQLLPVPTIYEFGDQGGILVLAKTGEATTSVYYSLDQGLTALQIFEFVKSPVHINNIVTDPSGAGSKFIVMAERQGQGLIIGLDFSAVFNRTCDEVRDYEPWTPKDGRQSVNGLNCLLGHDITYRRRRQNSYCANIPNMQKTLAYKNCSCTEDDWECDYGFERKDGSCVKVLDQKYPPMWCETGAEYYKSKGYRKVAGNTCEGGVQHMGDGPYKCPDEGVNLKSNKGWIAAVVIVPLVVIILVGAFFALRSEKLREKIPVLKVFHDWRVGYFKMSNSPQNDIVDDDEELAFSTLDEDADSEHFVNDHHNGDHAVELLHSQPKIETPAHHEDPFDPRK